MVNITISVVAALGTVISAYIMVKIRKVDTKQNEQVAATSEIHVIVNGRLTEALDRIAAFEQRYGIPSGAPIPPPTPDEEIGTLGV